MSTQAINLNNFSNIESIFDNNDTQTKENLSFVGKISGEKDPNIISTPLSEEKNEEVIKTQRPSISFTKKITKKSNGDVLDPQTWTNMFNLYKK